MQVAKLLVKSSNLFTSKGFRLARKKTLDISDLPKYLTENGCIEMPKGFNVSDKVAKFDEVVIQQKYPEGSAFGGIYENRILSLKDDLGNLLQRIRIGSNGDVSKISEYSYNNVVQKDVWMEAPYRHKLRFDFGKAPVHNRIQTTSYIYGKEVGYKETDVILYPINKYDKKAIKTTYETYPQCWDNNFSAESTKIEACGARKDRKIYSRTSYYTDKTGEVFNSKSGGYGFSEKSSWLDGDRFIHCKVQSNPQRIARSTLNQMGLKETEIVFEPMSDCSYGFVRYVDGKRKVFINDNLNIDDVYYTALHEGRHILQRKQQERYISELIKGMSTKEIEEYVARNNNTKAYLFKQFLRLDSVQRDNVRKLAFEMPPLTKKELKEVKKQSKEFANYVTSEENFEIYQSQNIERQARYEEHLGMANRNFYQEDYNIFAPDGNYDTRYLLIG